MQTIEARRLQVGDVIVKPNGDRQEVGYVDTVDDGDVIADTYDLVGEFLIVERFLSRDLVDVASPW